jgi:cytochrome c-type protein NapC
MKHLMMYVTAYANTGPDGEGGPPIKLYRRQDLERAKITDEQFNRHMNGICMQCHSTFSSHWGERHDPFAEDLRAYKQPCIDCHSEIHPLALSRRRTAQAKEATR